jgi:phage shock protein A/DNA-binding XRE family transcriptional regulator
MGYRLRIHNRVRAWLTDLRGAEPEVARAVGEAVLAMLEAGEDLGPPVVVPLGTVLRSPEDPREALDYSYERQLEMLQRVRRAVADVATSRKRVELQVSQLEQNAAKLVRQVQDALEAGREDVAGDAQTRAAAVQEQLSEMRQQLVALRGEEERLTAASQRLQAKVDAFRTRKETIKASYTADEASRRVRAAFADIGEDAGDLEVTDAEAEISSAVGDASAAASELRKGTPDRTPAADDGSGRADEGGAIPPGLMELRPGAPDNLRTGLLFAVEPEDTAVVLAWVDDPSRSSDEYQEVIRLAASRLAMAQSGAAPPAAAPPAAAPPAAAPPGAAPPGVFISYDAESFLDEFFPGEETEVEIGAAALAARHRAHTLAQARQRMRLTQAQVAARMNVRQERVSAIERAEPGATEVRTLAAYVRALGGRLEIIADIDGERVVLR